MISLKDFVSETLIQIVQGAQIAQDTLGDAATISPPRLSKRVILSEGTTSEMKSTLTHNIDFDVQIIASAGSETKGGAGVRLHVISVGAQGQSKIENQHINRVQFTIPIVFDSAGGRGRRLGDAPERVG